MEEAYQLDGELNTPEEKQTSQQTKKKIYWLENAAK